MKSENTILDRFAKYAEKRVVEPLVRSKRLLYASSVYEVCEREEALAAIEGTTRRRTIPADVTFAAEIGIAIGSMLQSRIMPMLDTPDRRFIGMWRCLDCNRLQGGNEPSMWLPRPTTCPCGGWQGFRFVEAKRRDYNRGIVCRPDGAWLVTEDTRIRIELAEFKTCRQDMLKSYMRGGLPPSWIWQVQTEMLLTGYESCRFIVVGKNITGIKHSLGEFVVERDAEIISAIEAKAASIWSAILNGDLNALPQRICSSSDCTRAKTCPLSERCFALPPEAQAADAGTPPGTSDPPPPGDGEAPIPRARSRPLPQREWDVHDVF